MAGRVRETWAGVCSRQHSSQGDTRSSICYLIMSRYNRHVECKPMSCFTSGIVGFTPLINVGATMSLSLLSLRWRIPEQRRHQQLTQMQTSTNMKPTISSSPASPQIHHCLPLRIDHGQWKRLCTARDSDAATKAPPLP